MNLIKPSSYFQRCTERGDGKINLPSSGARETSNGKKSRRKRKEGRKRNKSQRRCWATRGGMRSLKTVKRFASCAQQPDDFSFNSWGLIEFMWWTFWYRETFRCVSKINNSDYCFSVAVVALETIGSSRSVCGVANEKKESETWILSVKSKKLSVFAESIVIRARKNVNLKFGPPVGVELSAAQQVKKSWAWTETNWALD